MDRRRVGAYAGLAVVVGLIVAVNLLQDSTYFTDNASASAGLIGEYRLAYSPDAPYASTYSEADSELETVEAALDDEDNAAVVEATDAHVELNEPPPLFVTAEEGALREKSLEALFSLTDPEYSMFSQREQPPRLVLLKLHKVGGTSVAMALRNATKHYNLKDLEYADRCFRKGNYDIFFQHSTNSPWMDRCMPGRAMVTLFREPVGRTISKFTWGTNRDYFINYPQRPCDYAAGDQPPKGKFNCHDNEFRHNYTLEALVRHLKQPQSSRCGESCMSIVRSQSNKPKDAIAALQKEYALYGTTEHLDEFIVLLALRFGWSLDTMIYHKCKDQGPVKVSARDLVGEHAWALDKVRELSSEEGKVHEFARSKFEAFLARLGPDFHALVGIFKSRLRAFQDAAKARKNGSLRWRPIRFVKFC